MNSGNDRKRPNSRRNLDFALQRLQGPGARLVQARMAMANAIVGQMLKDVVIKGGTSLRMRYGREASRYTVDCDVSMRTGPDEFAEGLRAALAEGWNGFSGELATKRPARPKNVPPEYVMRPFEVKLSYLGRSWCTVPLDAGFDELGQADEPEMRPVAEDIAELFVALGFPVPGPLPLMPLALQVAQKLHGVSAPRSDRARDLIDLQLVMANDPVDLAETGRICERLFKYRKLQKWPPVVAKGESWDGLYDAQKGKLGVLPDVDAAVAWANELVARIVAATSNGDGA